MRWGLKRNRTQWRDGLARTSWQDFERLLARHYRDAGYEVEHCGTAENASRFDGGVDLVLRRNGETVLVQSKHWNAAQVPHNDVHQLLGLLETRQAERAILITSGEFTPAAQKAASLTRRIELIDGRALRLMVDPLQIPESAPGTVVAPDAAWAAVAEKAKTGGRWGRRRQSPEDELKALAIRLLIGAIVVLIAFLFIRSQVQDLQSIFIRPVPRPAATAPQITPVATSSPQPSQPLSAPEASLPPPMTPEQLKEWEKKNAEAMEVLEQTTPSVYD